VLCGSPFGDLAVWWPYVGLAAGGASNRGCAGCVYRTPGLVVFPALGPRAWCGQPSNAAENQLRKARGLSKALALRVESACAAGRGAKKERKGKTKPPQLVGATPPPHPYWLAVDPEVTAQGSNDGPNTVASSVSTIGPIVGLEFGSALGDRPSISPARGTWPRSSQDTSRQGILHSDSTFPEIAPNDRVVGCGAHCGGCGDCPHLCAHGPIRKGHRGDGFKSKSPFKGVYIDPDNMAVMGCM
jgi:hypothetical protein